MPPSKNRVSGVGLLCAAITFTTWGMVGIWVRLLHLPPLFIVGARMLIAFCGLMPVVLLSVERRNNLLRTARMGPTWILAAALIAYYTLAVTAFQLGTVAEVSLFVGTSPAFILLTRLLRGLPLRRREIVGALLAIVGVVVVLGPKILITSGQSKYRLMGDFVALASAGMSALYAATYRAAHEMNDEAPDPIGVAVLACGVGGVLITAATSVGRPEVWRAALQTHEVSVLLVLGLASTAVPSVTYALASRRLPAILTTTSQLMIPVVSTVAAAVILKEIPPVAVYIGGALIVFGIIYMFAEDKPVVSPEEEALD